MLVTAVNTYSSLRPTKGLALISHLTDTVSNSCHSVLQVAREVAGVAQGYAVGQKQSGLRPGRGWFELQPGVRGVPSETRCRWGLWTRP